MNDANTNYFALEKCRAELASEKRWSEQYARERDQLRAELDAARQECERLRAVCQAASRLIYDDPWLNDRNNGCEDECQYCGQYRKIGNGHKDNCEWVTYRAAIARLNLLDAGTDTKRDCETCKNYIPNASWSICKLDYADSSDCASGKTNRYEPARAALQEEK